MRRPTGPRFSFVHRLLGHLERVEFDGAPRLLGIDSSGREILDELPGCVPPNLGRFIDDVLLAAGRLLRELHDATAGSELAGAHEVVCHNDPSPCNYVVADGRPVALIDFDQAAPGDRIRDVAYAGWLWTLTADDDGPSVAEQARQLRLFVEGYGWQPTPALVDAIMRRQAESHADTAARFAAPESRPARRARPMLRSDGAGLVVVVLGARGLGDRLPVRMMGVEPRPHGASGGCRPRAS